MSAIPQPRKPLCENFHKLGAETNVDWTLVSYGGAVHSFTDPTANMEGRAMYCERTAQRAYRAMWNLFEELQMY